MLTGFLSPLLAGRQLIAGSIEITSAAASVGEATEDDLCPTGALTNGRDSVGVLPSLEALPLSAVGARKARIVVFECGRVKLREIDEALCVTRERKAGIGRIEVDELEGVLDVALVARFRDDLHEHYYEARALNDRNPIGFGKKLRVDQSGIEPRIQEHAQCS